MTADETEPAFSDVGSDSVLPGQELFAVVDAAPDPEVAAFVDELRELFGTRALAILLYGSRIVPADSGARPSMSDFFVFVDDYRDLPFSGMRKLLMRLLPPTVFFHQLRSRPGVYGKFNLISARHLDRTTSPKMRDVYLAGRLSKRLLLLYSKDEATLSRVVEWRMSAVRRMHEVALALLPQRFSPVAYARKFLEASYLGELRPLEAGKVDLLFAQNRSYFQALFAGLLGWPPDWFDPAVGTDSDAVDPLAFRGERPLSRRAAEKLLKRSRRRGVLRWPKHVLTIDRWLDLLGEKASRSLGEDFRLSDGERRWALFHILKHYLRLRREGKLR